MKRLLLIFCCLALALGMLAACGTAKENPTETTGVATGTEETTAGDDTPENKRLGLNLSELNFNNEEVTIVQRNNTEMEIKGDNDVTAGLVNQKVYSRNERVMANLNVYLNFKTVPGTVNDIQEYVSKIRIASMSDTPEYDISSCYAYFSVQIAKEGTLANLLELPHVDLSKAWWNQSFVAVNTLNGRLYSLTGDITTSLIDETEVVFFNRSLVDTNFPEGEDLYDVVLAGDWTLEELEKRVHSVGYQESFGTLLVGYNSNAVDGLLMGTDVKICSRNANNQYQMAMASDVNYTMVERLKTLVHNESDGVFGTGSGAATSAYRYNYVNSFANGQGMFFIFRMSHARNVLSGYVLDYGILPMPKANAEQDNYQCTPHDEYSALAVFNNVSAERKERAGAVLELMGYYSNSEIRPLVYETMYKLRTFDEQTSKIFDLIVDNTTFDFGYVWSNVIGDPVHVFRNYIWQNEDGLASKVSGLTSDRLIAELMDYFYSED